MNVEYTTTICLFRALSDVMRVLRQSAITLENTYGSRLPCVTLQASPAVTGVPPYAFSFFLDADLPAATTEGQIGLGLALEIKANGEAYFVDGSIGWNRQDTPGTAVASPWDHLECPEWRSTGVREFFDGLPGYAKELVVRYEQALREYLRTAT